MLVSFLLSGNMIREIVKAPQLISHYYDHVQESNETNIVSYLILHYCIEDGTDSDSDEDRQLPFKSGEYLFAGISLYTPPQTFSLTKPEYHDQVVLHIIKNDRFISSAFIANIWQPPRLV